MNTREFFGDLEALLKKYGIKSITPMCCIDCAMGEHHHIKIGDDGRLSFCGMKVDAVDTVKVVRCKDCKYLITDAYKQTMCWRTSAWIAMSPDDYCSYGVRRGDGE